MVRLIILAIIALTATLGAFLVLRIAFMAVQWLDANIRTDRIEAIDMKNELTKIDEPLIPPLARKAAYWGLIILAFNAATGVFL